MFNKEELLSKSTIELADIARSFNINIQAFESAEQAADAVIAAQSEMENAEAETTETTKRTRKRVVKKDMTDHVYSVKGNKGSNLDTKAAKKKAKESADLFTTIDTEANPFPKHRGRKSKAELEYLAQQSGANDPDYNGEGTDDQSAPKRRTRKKQEPEQGVIAERSLPFAEETETGLAATNDVPNEQIIREQPQAEQDAVSTQQPEQEYVEQPMEQQSVDQQVTEGSGYDDAQQPMEQEQAEQETTEQASDEPNVPEATYTSNEEGNDEDNTNLIAQLQAKMNAHNQENSQNSNETTAAQDNVWDGDPGDGTDFIIIEDLPIEDTSATTNVDIFDNPVNVTVVDSYEKKINEQKKIEYDFNNIVRTIGVLEIMPENYGFLRSSDYNYLSSPDDVFIPMPQIRKFGLKTGDVVECMVCPPGNGDKYFTIQDILRINGRDPRNMRDRIPFEHLTPLFPDERFNLCGNPRTTNISTRIVDLFSPIGKGQRALIVAQPKTGKTILMKDIANAIAASHPEAYLMMLLIDERPEEVTDMARTVNAEVIASTFDEPAERHVKIAGLVLEKAKRMVECGHDVVIFLDSITRLARAYNTVAPASGKVLTGGVDANALQKPKRFFGAARNIEGGGSLTIIATALIDTGSKMDEVIFEEFKGTGNMELQLDRSLSNKRIFPAVNLIASSTRRDDLLQDKTTLDRMWVTRKFLSNMNPIEAMNLIHDKMQHTRDNDEFLLSINS